MNCCGCQKIGKMYLMGMSCKGRFLFILSKNVKGDLNMGSPKEGHASALNRALSVFPWGTTPQSGRCINKGRLQSATTILTQFFNLPRDPFSATHLNNGESNNLTTR